MLDLQGNGGGYLNAAIDLANEFLAGASTSAEAFLNVDTLKIVVLGLVAFACGTFGGVMLGKIMCKLTGGKKMCIRDRH